MVNALGTMVWGVVGLGFILIPFILEKLDDSWRQTLLAMGVVPLVVTILWLIFGKERVTPEYEAELRSQQSSPVFSILRYREIWILAGGMIGVAINFAAFETFWPSYMLDNFGVSLKISAMIITIISAVSAVMGLGIGVMVSRTGRKRSVLWISGILLSLSSVGLLFTGSTSSLILIAMANGLSWSFFPIIMTIPFELEGIKPREVAVTIGFLETAIWIGAFIGPLLVGGIQEVTGDLRTPLIIASLASFALTPVALMLPRKWDRLVTETQPLGP